MSSDWKIEPVWEYFRNGRQYGVLRHTNTDGSKGTIPRLFIQSGSNMSQGCRSFMVYWHATRRRSFTLEIFKKRRRPRFGTFTRGPVDLPPTWVDGPDDD